MVYRYKKLYSKYIDRNFAGKLVQKLAQNSLKVFKIFVCNLRQHKCNIHAKHPLFDSQSDREFTFSYAIQWYIIHYLKILHYTLPKSILFSKKTLTRLRVQCLIYNTCARIKKLLLTGAHKFMGSWF